LFTFYSITFLTIFLALTYFTNNSSANFKAGSKSFLATLEANNTEMEKILNSISQIFKEFNKQPTNKKLQKQLTELFKKLESFSNYYVIKENVLFPIIEQTWPDYRCLQIMWSFHDDIRNSIKYILNSLKSGIIDSKEFNRSIGDVFFNMLTIKFREERILFPYMLATIPEESIEKMTKESIEIGFPFVQPKNIEFKNESTSLNKNEIDLGTGNAENVAFWVAQVANTKLVTTEIVNIGKLSNRKSQKISSNSVIGFISPTHGFNYPPIMIHFIMRMPRANGNKVF